MSEIKHIVYLMLENRSLDQLLGWLYETEQPKHKINCEDPPTYDGLKKNTYFNLDAEGNKHFVRRGTAGDMNVPVHDPHEAYEHINVQIFGPDVIPSDGTVSIPKGKCATTNPKPGDTPNMSGFYQDFAGFKYCPEQIMQTYTPEELPVLNGLARNFAVSDRYFASVPSQTNTNRAFAASGNSVGMFEKKCLLQKSSFTPESWVNNRGFGVLPPHVAQPLGQQFNQKTLFNVLWDCGKKTTDDWMCYYSHESDFDDKILGTDGYSYVRDLMMQLQDKCFDAHFKGIDDFYQRAEAGTLPSFSFLEPEWGLEIPIWYRDVGVNGNDYHPPSNLQPGEVFLQKVYDALTSNKDAWADTLLIVNFDEHGGTYDHVPPPPATPPWGYGVAEPERKEGCFNYDRYGVRVPMILVSPRVKESTVFRAGGKIPYDHCSVIATILKMFDIPKEKWQLGARVQSAPTFENVWQGNPVRTDIPKIEANPPTKVQHKCAAELGTAPNDIQTRMAQSLLYRAVEHHGLDDETVARLKLPDLSNVATLKELGEHLNHALAQVFVAGKGQQAKT